MTFPSIDLLAIRQGEIKDLAGMNLAGADLAGADLAGANLRANLAVLT
jgi:uncharacterized protein YjbI with pentapeptide repeats